MRRKSKRDLRADLVAVRQDVLFRLQETEPAVPSPTCSPTCSPTFPPTFPPTEQTPPALLETIATRMLDELGGGEFRIMLKGEQTLAQRVAELAEEKQRMLHLRW